MPEDLMATELNVSIVLPVYNEVGHIEEELARIRESMDRSNLSYEIIVVDDGSTDGTAELLEQAADIRLLRFAQNRGSGSCRKYGTLSAKGTVVVWSDADMSYPNDRIPDLVADLDGWDQVVGARTSEEGTVKLLRKPTKWLIRKLASYLTAVKIPDLNSGFRAMRREVADQFLYLLPTGFSCVTTITMAFLSNGYSVKYVPIEYAPRAGNSKFHWWRDTRLYLLQVMRMVLLYSPLKVFMPPAVLIGLIGTGKLIFDLIQKHFRVATNTLVVLGVAMAFAILGMLADLLVQLNKRRHDVIPAETNTRSRPVGLGESGLGS
jgi:polyisoprenyl-phosphate glycosyltransferase